MRDRLFREKCALYGLATVTLARHRPAPLSLVTRARCWVARGSRAPNTPQVLFALDGFLAYYFWGAPQCGIGGGD